MTDEQIKQQIEEALNCGKPLGQTVETIHNKIAEMKEFIHDDWTILLKKSNDLDKPIECVVKLRTVD